MRFWISGIVIWSCLATSLWGIEAMVLHILQYPEGRRIEFRLFPTRSAGEGLMEAEVRKDRARSRIKLKYQGMKPAVLFGGEVTSFVVWAVTRQETAHNLGELIISLDEPEDEQEFTTSLQEFALIVTAESSPAAQIPSQLLLFWNDQKTDPVIPFEELFFEGFTEAPPADFESLGDVAYQGSKAPAVIQAERIFGQAQRREAERLTPQLYEEARALLEQARDMYNRSEEDDGASLARRSIQVSLEAIEVAGERLEQEKLEQAIRDRQAEAEALEGRAREAEKTLEQLREERRRMTAGMEEVSRQLEALRAERSELESQMGRLRQERQQLQREQAALESRLQGALSQVAETRESARGFIVSLPDILFDSGQSSLKPDARIAIAKLAGILLILQDLNLRIEGHTDSTGSAQLNQRLSEERAESVREWLITQGVEGRRIVTAGYGQDRPVADNSTRAGRRQNRRVEIIVAEGSISESAG